MTGIIVRRCPAQIMALFCAGCMVNCWCLVQDAGAQNTWYVSPTGDDAPAGGGTNWDTAFASLSNALARAVTTPALILVSNGIYQISATITNNKAVIIRSYGADGLPDKDGTIIDGGDTHRCFRLDHSNAIVDGFTITNGYVSLSQYAVGGGAGAYIAANGGMLTNCAIAGNVVESWAEGSGGGGVYMLGGALYNCLLFGNTATSNANGNYRQSGGGIYMGGGLASDCSIYANSAPAGWGGGGLSASTGTAQRCIVSNNNARSSGGAYLNGSATMIDSDLVNNTAVQNGGGARLQGADARLENCVVAGNIAGVDGGGIYMSQGTVEGCEIADNVCHGANNGGGGLLVAATSTNSAWVFNCVIRNNRSSSLSSFGGGGANLKNAVIKNCRVLNNYANQRGGGLYLQYASIVDGCHIISNVAAQVGGGAYVYHDNPSVEMKNSLISGNVASNSYGGGIYSRKNSGGMISACAIVDNVVTGTPASQFGAGVYVYDATPIINCIIASNRWNGTAGVQERDLSFFNIALADGVHYCCVPRDLSAYNHGNITSAPAFADSDYRLRFGSPGINAGTNQPWMAAPGAGDLDGRLRIDRFNGIVDMGCYEYVFPGTLYLAR